MFKRRLLTLLGMVLLALSTAAWADDDIQVLDEAAPTVTPVTQAKPAPPVKKATERKAKPTPTPDEDEGYEQVDRTQRDRDLGKKLGELDRPLLLFTLDALYSKGFDLNRFNTNFSSGVGGDFRMEVQFYQRISLGLYYDFVDFTGPGALSGSFGMFGRIIPLKEGPLEFYAIGGLGINSLVHTTSVDYPGNFHGFTGAGIHTSFTDNFGLDGNLVYNYYSPQDESLNTVAVRVGLTYAVDLHDFFNSLAGSGRPKVVTAQAKEPESF